jgi:hypothetical protein
MGKVEDLAAVYQRHLSVPWQRGLAGAQRVMLVVYEKELERTVRARIGEFEQATLRSGHGWTLVDCTAWFAAWMASDDYREAYFDTPSLLGMKIDGDFRREVIRRLAAEVERAGDDTVVAFLGVASLFGFVRVSEVIRQVEPSIRGRLVVFFPGTKNENNYRLLDARDGWNYLASGITLHGGGTGP